MQISMFKWVPRKGSEVTVSRILKPSIRFERSVCTDMEPCYIERRAQLSEEQDKGYKQLIKQAATDLRGSTITAVNSAVLLGKLVQIAAGVAYAADGSLAKFDYGPRLAVLEELIEENGEEKVLVFVPFTGVLESLAEKLRKKWSVAILNGDVSSGKRNQIFKDFRNGKDPHILLCHPQVMAHGLDLTTATLSIWYAPFTKAEIYQQANARTDGSKQKSKIDIAHIFATPEEKRIYAVLKEAGRLQEIVLALANKKM
jgi:SNF2 family DNA or RNA helicase